MENPGATEVGRKSTLAIVSFVAGALSLLLLLASLQPLPATPAEQLAFVAGHRTFYGWFAGLVLAWAVFSVPFVVTLGAVLRPRGGIPALTATILSAVGILLLGFAVFAHAGAMLSIVAAGDPPRPDDAAYQAAIWASLRFYLTDPGLMAWGLGQFMFGWFAWKSGILPDWLSIVGMIGGIAGLLTLGIYQSGALALVQICSFAVWGFSTGVLLLRSRGS
ncbi:hypothetical protein BURK1_03575 [Burkholderiales bacterium]|nr:hypothetical protein BURK1_03575 [Burkholderiales bacterium]